MNLPTIFLFPISKQLKTPFITISATVVKRSEASRGDENKQRLKMRHTTPDSVEAQEHHVGIGGTLATFAHLASRKMPTAQGFDDS